MLHIIQKILYLLKKHKKLKSDKMDIAFVIDLAIIHR